MATIGQTCFWLDRWISNDPLCESFAWLVGISEQKYAKVRDMGGYGRWSLEMGFQLTEEVV